jgi:hypothetical protein
MCYNARTSTKFGDDPVTVDYYVSCFANEQQTLLVTFGDGSTLTLALDERLIMAGVPEFSCDTCRAQFHAPPEWNGLDDLPCPICGDLQTRAGGHDDLCGTSLAARWYDEQQRRLLEHPDATRVKPRFGN